MAARLKSEKVDGIETVTTKDLEPLVDSQQIQAAQLIPYSTFTKSQKWLIVFLIAFAGMFSPLSSFIYYPAITSLSKDLDVSIEMINLTITSYMIVSGIAPAILGDLADMTGRRWVYILTLTIYCAANVGLALQRSWSALLVLRMVQSVGSSATISIAYGIVADIASPAERGSFVGAVLCGPNVAPSLGPVLGGVLSQFVGWRWIFWTLVLLSGICLLWIGIFLPETSRHIVGNGSIPTAWYHQTAWSLLQRPRSQKQQSTQEPPKRNFHVPNPISCLKLLFHRSTSLIILVNGIYYMTYGCIQASMSSLFIELYDFNELEAGLIYLPFGVGCALASLVSGYIMNWDYRRTASEYGFVIDKVSGDDLTRFPIEKARFRSISYAVTLSSACIVGYGWALQAHTVMKSVAVSLILQFLLGSAASMVFNMCGTLLVDLHPKSPASAQAALNIVRCSLSAGGLALLQFVIDRVGVGWCFTIFAGLCLSMLLPIWTVHRYGMIWRKAQITASRVASAP
ncbi:multidrug resistance protein [Amylocarpus encephaloides]|uniref:Multidrug resistance protein n=1 Tax=Amylocarpus encephaloides TaxID=45428 RepID=A0A9P7YPE5_9HELO|nr:multidrug resistance protein [Amylocarpus encephaloides]